SPSTAPVLPQLSLCFHPLNSCYLIFVAESGTRALHCPVIVAIGFERIPTEPPPRNAEVSTSPYSLSPDAQRTLSRDRCGRWMRREAVARISFPPVSDLRR